jgi:hypothetical protein
MTKTVEIPTLDSVTAEGYAAVTVYINFDFGEYDGLCERLPYEGNEEETQEEFAERLEGMVEDAVRWEIETMFDGFGCYSGQPDVSEVEVESVTITDSNIETDTEEVEIEEEEESV